MPSNDERTALRQSILGKRRQLGEQDRLLAGQAVASKFKEHAKLKEKPLLIGSYVSLSGELPSTFINELILNSKHQLALPYMNLKEKGSMDFYRFSKEDELVENRFHILEPKPDFDRRVYPDELDMLIIPLVGIDSRGNRLGMGGGYYDRMLKKVRKDCIAVGVGYDFQLVDVIPKEHWDMPLDEVILPLSHLIFNAKYSVG